mmetsp:Transcript_4925/g.20934  ORF Transcript_4925/g.20934 Transcript_4925/m.20934 type:complete len:319 (+) Transcript_4925:418-1374(+)
MRPANVLPLSACAATDIAFKQSFAPSSATRGARRARNAACVLSGVSSATKAVSSTRSTKTASAEKKNASTSKKPSASSSHGGVFGSDASARTHRNANDKCSSASSPPLSACLARSRAIARRAAIRWRAARAPAPGAKSTSRNVGAVRFPSAFRSETRAFFLFFPPSAAFASASRTYASHETSKHPLGGTFAFLLVLCSSPVSSSEPYISVRHPPPPNARYFSKGVPNVGRCSEASTSAETVTPSVSLSGETESVSFFETRGVTSATSANSATLTRRTSPPAATAAPARAHAEAHAPSRDIDACVFRVAAANADKARVA